MSETCARHPAHRAWWQCPRCFKTLCQLCIARKSKGFNNSEKLYFCPICDVEAENLPLSRILPPLWKRLPRLLAYPFSAGSSAVLAPALAFMATLFTHRGFFPAAVQFAFWSIAVTYAFAALKSTSSGSLRPPALTLRIWRAHLPMVLRQITLYTAIYLSFLFLAAEAHGWIAIAAAVLCASAFPAVLILLTVHESLIRALNPLRITRCISRTGGSYCQLCCALLLLIGIVTVIGIAIDSHLPGWFRIFALSAACNYATIIFYHMAGYVLLQYHQRLDYPVDLKSLFASLDRTGPGEGQVSAGQPRSTKEDLLVAINRLDQNGDPAGAIRQIEMHAKAILTNDLDLSQRYLDLLRIVKNQRKFLDHASRHLELLAKSGYNSEALSLYMECIRLDKNFAPQALVLFKLAGWLDETGKSREAVYVLNCLIKYHPQNTMVPKALYRVAQIFHQGMKDAERSKKVLTGLIRRFPDHEITAFARNYLSGL
jgi:tetratricopeptide (TPR) repeat protein